MKRIFTVIAIALVGVLAMGLVACGGTGGGSSIKVNPSELNFDAAGSTKTVTVDSDTDWTYTADSWITVSKSGNSLSVTVGANSTAGPRSGKITVTNAEDNANVSVTQAAATSSGDPADAFVGEWIGYLLYWNGSQAYEFADWPVTITKVDSNTILADDAYDMAEIWQPGFDPACTKMTMTINSDGTINTVPQLFPGWATDPTIVAYQSAHVTNTMADYNTGLQNVPASSSFIDFAAVGFPDFLTSPTDSKNGALWTLGQYPNGDTGSFGNFYCALTYTRASGAPAMLVAPRMTKTDYTLNPNIQLPTTPVLETAF